MLSENDIHLKILNLRNRTSEKYKSAIMIMHTQLYFYLTGSILANDGVNQNIRLFITGIKRKALRLFLLIRPIQADIYIWVGDISHLKQTIGIAERLNQLGKKTVFLTSKQSLVKTISLSKIKTLYIPLPVPKKANQKKTTSFKKAIKEIKPEVFHSNDIEKIAKCYTYWSIYSNQLYRFYGQFLKRHRPGCMIIGYDVLMEGRAITLACKNLKIKTFMVQHGSVAMVNGIFSTHEIDEYLIFGNATKKILEASHCKAKLTITGAPYLDNLVEFQKAPSIIETRIKTILIAFSGPGHLTSVSHHKQTIKLIADVVKELSHIKFIIKLHKKDNANYYYDLNQYPNVNFNIDNTHSTDIFNWLKQCNLLITTASTVAYEAMLMNIPVVTIDLTGEYKEIAYVKEGAVIYTTNKESLINAIQGLSIQANLHQIIQNSKKHLESCYGQIDGNATDRCVAIISDYIDKSHELI